MVAKVVPSEKPLPAVAEKSVGSYNPRVRPWLVAFILFKSLLLQASGAISMLSVSSKRTIRGWFKLKRSNQNASNVLLFRHGLPSQAIKALPIASR